MKKRRAIDELLRIMARLRSPTGCPWDREQSHKSIRFHAVEEVYEMIDAIEAGDDHELEEELGDLLLQVVFHCQLARERGVFDFEKVARRIAEKLVHRHPHVFGEAKVKDVDAVWAQWERIKRAEKAGTRHERASSLDGVPRHLPALLRAEKLVKKARKAGLIEEEGKAASRSLTRRKVGDSLLELASEAQRHGWSAEVLLREATARAEKRWRGKERSAQ